MFRVSYIKKFAENWRQHPVCKRIMKILVRYLYKKKMCKFKFFHILLLCVMNGPSMAAPNLSEDYCQELAKSDRFTKMISELQQKVPIESYNLEWDKNSTIKYDKLLPVLSLFMDKVKAHTWVLKNVKGPEKDRLWHPGDGYVEADRFFNKTHPELMKIMKKKHNNKKGLMGIFSGSFTVEEVLNETLECANRVNLRVTKFREDNDDLWKQLDVKFEAQLQKIWMPSNLYKECHELSESDRFGTMVRILKERIPIWRPDLMVWDAWPWGQVNYAKTYDNYLAAMQEFMNELRTKKGVVFKSEVDRIFSSKHRACNDNDALTFVKTHEDLIDILKKKCGTITLPVKRAGNETFDCYVGNVLDGVLKCANDVHQYQSRQRMLAVPYEEKWTKLDYKFELAIGKILGKAKNMEGMTSLNSR